jgi:hypothetical protein
VKLTKRTRVELEGRGTLTLAPSQHLATGGEASVYLVGNTIIKLYTDSNKLSQPGMLDNLRQLSGLTYEYIVAPKGLVFDSRGVPIGYYMDYVLDDEPLSSIFTNDYRNRVHFGDEQASLLVDRMLQVMAFAHERSAIMVDPNELNWTTVPAKHPARDPRGLDVDSWLIGSYRPPKIPMMASIRDWHNKKIGQETDRFALAVVTFPVYTGIHPYKGTLAGYERDDLEGRMKDNASVFSDGVRLSQAVRDFGCIPGPLLGWYQAVFQQGERSAPPSPYYTGVTTPPRTVRMARIVTTTSGTLKYERLFAQNGDPVVRVFPCGVVLLRSGKLVDLVSKRQLATTTTDKCEVVRVDGGWVLAEGDPNPTFTFINNTSLQSQPLSVNLNAQRIVRYQNRLFGVTNQGLIELLLKQFARPILMVGQTWQTMVNATRWFDGVGVLDAMGATFLIAPFGEDSCAQLRVRELDGLRVVTAKAGHRFISVIAVDKKGEYRKIEFTFDRAYKTYTTWEGDAENPELNMALLPRGVMATVVRDGELVIFVPTSGTINRAADKDVTTSMLLSNWDNRVVYIRDGQLWAVSMS